MSVRIAQENAVLDALARKAGTFREVVFALEGNGMRATQREVQEILAGLARRGLASRAGSGYRITPSGRASVRCRKAGYRARYQVGYPVHDLMS